MWFLAWPSEGADRQVPLTHLPTVLVLGSLELLFLCGVAMGWAPPVAVVILILQGTVKVSSGGAGRWAPVSRRRLPVVVAFIFLPVSPPRGLEMGMEEAFGGGFEREAKAEGPES
uniref:Uncharacterized protein n=1 Tax=Arundo donax TaxID=35708 RepID=A0A0A9H6C0_ARUDO